MLTELAEQNTCQSEKQLLCAAQLNPHQSLAPQSPSEARYRHRVARAREISQGHIAHQMQTRDRSGEPRSHPSQGRSRDILRARCGEAGLLSRQVFASPWLPEERGAKPALLSALRRSQRAWCQPGWERPADHQPLPLHTHVVFGRRAPGFQTAECPGTGLVPFNNHRKFGFSFFSFFFPPVHHHLHRAAGTSCRGYRAGKAGQAQREKEDRKHRRQ